MHGNGLQDMTGSRSIDVLGAGNAEDHMYGLPSNTSMLQSEQRVAIVINKVFQ